MSRHPIPKKVAKEAEIGIQLMDAGFLGGTQTGWNRANQLATHKTIPIQDLAVMRAWFARHGPDAANGGTSYVGYRKWVDNGRPMKPRTSKERFDYRGAVAWLIWGGDPAYEWLKTAKIRKALKEQYPKRKEASRQNNLI